MGKSHTQARLVVGADVAKMFFEHLTRAAVFFEGIDADDLGAVVVGVKLREVAFEFFRAKPLAMLQGFLRGAADVTRGRSGHTQDGSTARVVDSGRGAICVLLCHDAVL